MYTNISDADSRETIQTTVNLYIEKHNKTSCSVYDYALLKKTRIQY